MIVKPEAYITQAVHKLVEFIVTYNGVQLVLILKY